MIYSYVAAKREGGGFHISILNDIIFLSFRLINCCSVSNLMYFLTPLETASVKM